MKGEGIENHSSNNDEPIFFWSQRWLCVAAAINPSSMAQKIYHYRLPQTIVNRYIWVQTLFTPLLPTYNTCSSISLFNFNSFWPALLIVLFSI